MLWLIMLTACSGARTPPPTPPQREITISSASANAFKERLGDATQTLTASGPTPRTVEIEIREEELTSYLALSAKDAGYTAMGALRVWITNDGLWVRVPISNATDPLLAMLQPSAREGEWRITIAAATWRGRTLPRWLLASAEAVANDALADANLALDVEQIILGEGSLHILLNSR